MSSKKGFRRVDVGEFQRTFEALHEHCRRQGLESKMADDSLSVIVSVQAGHSRESLEINSPSSAERWLQVPLELYRFLDRYNGIYSVPLKTVEVILDSPDALALNGFLKEEAPPDPADPEGRGLVLPSAPSGRLSRAKVSIGAVSEELAALSGVRCPPRGWDPYLEYHGIPQMSMRVSGVELETHDDAIHVIESVVFSWLLQLEVVLGLRCTVEKVSTNTVQRVDLVHHGDISDLNFPTSRYDPEAVLLYWHANGLFGQPILQFLAYYQVVEYYFNRYAQAEAQRRVRKVLTSPGFSPHRAEDILRLMGTVRGGDRNIYGDERSQFRATMNECIEAEDLARFLYQTDPIRNYLTTKGWAEISKVGVALNSKTASDLRPAVAERLYDIRCKIVHTKTETSEEGELVRVLPVSREAGNLTFDTQIMKWVAQRVLFASGSHLDL